MSRHEVTRLQLCYQNCHYTELSRGDVAATLSKNGPYWGEPERAPHRQVCCGICLYIYNIHYISYVVPKVTSVSYFASSCVICYFKNYSQTGQREDTNCCTSSMATARTETTRGPTYSKTRTIWATPWQKGFICRYHCLRCH